MNETSLVYVDTSALGAILVAQPETQAAMRLDAQAVLTYDYRLGDAARTVGLGVISPGAPDAGTAAR